VHLKSQGASLIMLTAVTGASGHVGANLINALVSKGRKVRALSHTCNLGLDGLPIDLWQGDVGDLDSLIEAFHGVRVVYHLAAHISLRMNDWRRCAEVNIEGTRNVIEACRRTGVQRLVHFSSIHALCSEPLDTPVDESRPHVSSPDAPPYDRSKAAGEKLVLSATEAGLDAVIINPTGVIGPFDYRPSHFGQALIQIATGKIPVLIEGGFDWVDARDVAQTAIKAEESAAAGSRYLLSGHWLSMRDIAVIAAGIMGNRAPSLVCPMAVARACAPIITAASGLSRTRPIFTTVSLDALVSNRNISHEKATSELGYAPRPARETISDTIQWFKDNGYIKSS
jgi:dihydroflavonol-4-reductase